MTTLTIKPELILRAIERAHAGMKGAPYIGIPIPGRRPFVVSREKLYVATNHGMEIRDVVSHLTAHGEHVEHLTVTGRSRSAGGGWIKRRYKFHNLNMDLPGVYPSGISTIRDVTVRWAESKRKARESGASMNLEKTRRSKAEIQLAKVQAEMAKIARQLRPGKNRTTLADRLKWRPRNPLLLGVQRGNAQPGRVSSPEDYDYQLFWNWKQERPRRKLLARIARQSLKTMQWKDVYARLRAAGFTNYETRSKAAARKDGLDSIEYLQQLWKYVSGFSRSSPRNWDSKSYRNPAALQEHWTLLLKDHRHELIRYADTIREEKELRGQLANLQELARAYAEMADERKAL